MQQLIEMTTLSEVLEKLRKKGVDNEIEMNDESKMFSDQLNKVYVPEDLLIFKTFRFEGDSDPADNAVLYLVEDMYGDIGYILDAYGVYSNHKGAAFDDFIKKIKVEDRMA